MMMVDHLFLFIRVLSDFCVTSTLSILVPFLFRKALSLAYTLSAAKSRMLLLIETRPYGLIFADSAA